MTNLSNRTRLQALRMTPKERLEAIATLGENLFLIETSLLHQEHLQEFVRGARHALHDLMCDAVAGIDDPKGETTNA